VAEHYLEPVVHATHFLYDKPNKALRQILCSAKMDAIVTEYATKVAAAYVQRVGPRSKSGDLAAHVSVHTYIGGYDKGRVVGEVVSSSGHALVDEFGRDAFNPYEGSHDLRDSLYSILPQKI
jgi:hypothetical protein